MAIGRNVDSGRWCRTSLVRQEIHRCCDQGKSGRRFILQLLLIDRPKAFVCAIQTDLKMLHIYTPSDA